MGGVRAFGLLLLVAGTLALFCLGISSSFLATNATTEVCCAPAGKALGDGEALVRPDEDPSGLLTTPGEEAREGEELSVRASVLRSMFVLAASSFFSTSGLVLDARNSSLKGGVSHSLGVLLGGSSAAGCGRASFLGVFLL